MARRADHTRDELSELIIDASTRIISEEGLSSLTVRKIASQVGYSPGSVYNVFSNLDDLIAHVNTRTMRALISKLSKVRTTGDVLTDVKAILHVYLDFQDENSSLWSANTEHSIRQDFEQPECYKEALHTAIEIVAAPIFPALDADSTHDKFFSVRVLWAALAGISAVPKTSKYLENHGGNVRSMAENLVDNYIHGLMRGLPQSSRNE